MVKMIIQKHCRKYLNYHNRKIEKTLGSRYNSKLWYFGKLYKSNISRRKLKTSDIYSKTSLTYKFISDFEHFSDLVIIQKGIPKSMSHNTVMKHLQRLRKIVTLAYHLEWIDKDPFVRWKPTFETKAT